MSLAVCVDLAVGAPLEGAGVVYIFRGSAGAISPQYSQRITAADVSRAAGLTNFGHTFGHTPDLDLDSNTYPDLIIGAYSAQTVVVLRSKPVVNVVASLMSYPGMINPYDTLCFDGQTNNCFQLKICLGFSAKPADRQELLVVLVVSFVVCIKLLIYVLISCLWSIVLKQRSSKVLTFCGTWVYFKGQPENSNYVEGIIAWTVTVLFCTLCYWYMGLFSQWKCHYINSANISAYLASG